MPLAGLLEQTLLYLIMFWTRKLDFQLDLFFENGHVTWLRSRATCNGFLFLTLKDKLGTQSELTDSEIALLLSFMSTTKLQQILKWISVQNSRSSKIQKAQTLPISNSFQQISVSHFRRWTTYFPSTKATLLSKNLQITSQLI